jgi:hypothetical protein
MSVRDEGFFWICPEPGISVSLDPLLPKTIEMRGDLLDEDEVTKHS